MLLTVRPCPHCYCCCPSYSHCLTTVLVAQVKLPQRNVVIGPGLQTMQTVFGDTWLQDLLEGVAQRFSGQKVAAKLHSFVSMQVRAKCSF